MQTAAIHSGSLAYYPVPKKYINRYLKKLQGRKIQGTCVCVCEYKCVYIYTYRCVYIFTHLFMYIYYILFIYAENTFVEEMPHYFIIHLILSIIPHQ